MGEAVEKGAEEVGRRLVSDGATRVGQTNSSSPPKTPQGSGVPAAGRRGVLGEWAPPVLRNGTQVERVGGFHPVFEYGQHPGSASEPAFVPQGYGASAPQDKPRMANGFKRGREYGKGEGRKGEEHTEDRDLRGYQEGYAAGKESRYEGGDRDWVGYGEQGGGYYSSSDGKCPVGRYGVIGTVRGGQNCQPSALYSAHNPSVLGDAGLRGTKGEGGGGGILAFPGFARGSHQELPQESEPALGAALPKKRIHPTLSGGGNEGCGPSPHHAASDNGYPQQVSGIGLADRGEEDEGGERQGFESSGDGWEDSEGERGDGGGDGGRDGGRDGGGGGYVGIPKFVKKNFVDPPSWEELQKTFKNVGEIQRIRFPLNVKRVSKGNIKKLRELSFVNEECKLFLYENLRVLYDEKLYKEMTEGSDPPPLQKPSLSRNELDSLEGYKFEKAKEKPIWGTFPFKVAEPQKKRCRAIFDCKINKVVSSTPQYSLKNKQQIREDFEKIKLYNYIFVQFDFRSFYDQFPLWKLIRKYFGFLGHNGMWYWLLLLPMGFRLAVACAQATMWAFLNFYRDPEVSVATIIDNVCFSGPREKVYEAINTFLTRVFLCSFSLNKFEEIKFLELSHKQKMVLFRSLEETQPEFLGEKYNFVKNTRCLNEKTVEKLRVVWGVLGEELGEKKKSMSNRQLFSLFGILIYATEILNISTFSFFNLFKKIRKISKYLSDHEDEWDNIVDLQLTNKEYFVLKNWVKIVLANKPVFMTAGKKAIPRFENFKADFYIVLDASSWGWGALLFGSVKNFLSQANGQWAKGDYGASTKAEPLGVEAAVGWWSKRIAHKKVAILTDHKNLVYAFSALFIHSWFYNRCMEKLDRLQVENGTEFQIYYLQGEKNTADGVSRGATVVENKVFPWVEGAGMDTALPCPWQM